MSESAHKTHPLPNKSEDGYAVYSKPDGHVRVYRHPKGHYVADHDNRYDHSEPTAEKMRAHLKKEKAKYNGWDSIDESLAEDAPTNSMGASSSTSGPIASYDPMLMKKKKLQKFSTFTRKKPDDV